MLKLSEENFDSDWSSLFHEIDSIVAEGDAEAIYNFGKKFSAMQETFGLDQAYIERVEESNAASDVMALALSDVSSSPALQSLRENFFARSTIEELLTYFSPVMVKLIQGDLLIDESVEVSAIEARLLIEAYAVSELTSIKSSNLQILPMMVVGHIPNGHHLSYDEVILFGDTFQLSKAAFETAAYDSRLPILRRSLLEEAGNSLPYTSKLPHLSGLLASIMVRDYDPERIFIWGQEVELLSSHECALLVEILNYRISKNPSLSTSLYLLPARRLLVDLA